MEEQGGVGHAGALTVSLRNRGPISSLLGFIIIPPAVIVYICAHSSSEIVTVAISLSIIAEPANMTSRYFCIYVHIYIMESYANCAS